MNVCYNGLGKKQRKLIKFLLNNDGWQSINWADRKMVAALSDRDLIDVSRPLRADIQVRLSAPFRLKPENTDCRRYLERVIES